MLPPPLQDALFGGCRIPLTGTGGRGPSHDGGRGPSGHSGLPSASGSRGPWNAGASWADRYASCLNTSCNGSLRRAGPSTTTAGQDRPRSSYGYTSPLFRDASNIIAYIFPHCQLHFCWNFHICQGLSLTHNMLWPHRRETGPALWKSGCRCGKLIATSSFLCYNVYANVQLLAPARHR